MSDVQDQSKNVEFLSKNIKPDETKYFTKTRKRFNIKATLERLDKSPLFQGKRKIITICCGTLIVVAAIATPIIIISSLRTDVDSTAAESLDARIRRVQDEVAVIFNDDGANAGIAKYQEYIDNARSNEERAQLYIWRASDLYRLYDGDFSEEIIQDAYSAEKAYPTAETAFSIAYYEGKWGNKEVSDRYFAIFTDRNPQPTVDVGGSL